MKKLLLILILVFGFTGFIACGTIENTTIEETSAMTTGKVELPVAMSLDTSDGAVKLPFEIDGDEETITWSSSDETIASVDDEGYVSAHENGQVIITAQSGDYVSSLELIATKDKYTDYTRINTKAEFLMIFSDPSNFNSLDNKYCLSTDIDFGGDNIDSIGGWDVSDEDNPIDPSKVFRATLDGRGYALMNFTIIDPYMTNVNGAYYGVSLFPFIDGGTIRNLNIIGATFSGSGFTGSIAGKITNGIIENCFVQATVISRGDNMGIPAGGIAAIVGPDAIIRNVLLDVKVEGGYIYTGFNFGTGTNSNAISETLDDADQRRPIQNTASTTNKGNDDEDAALNDFINSSRIENEDLGNLDRYNLTEDAKENFWTITDGTMPFLIRADGLTPDWAIITDGEN